MSIILTHPHDPTLTLTLGPPSKDAWREAWNTLSTARSKDAGTMSAGYNLIMACAVGITPAEIPALVDDWPFVTIYAMINCAILAGQIAFEVPAEAQGVAEVNAWRMDLAAVVKAGKALGGALLPDDAPDRADLETLQSSGLTIDACEDILSRFGRRGQLTAIRTSSAGVVVIRRPRFMADVLAHANNVTAYGHFEAAERLAAACTVYPLNISAKFNDAPALATSIAKLANEMVQEGAGAAVKKG